MLIFFPRFSHVNKTLRLWKPEQLLLRRQFCTRVTYLPTAFKLFLTRRLLLKFCKICPYFVFVCYSFFFIIIKMKYILVTGGVMSGVGKGIIASSIGTLLKSCGVHVTSIKIDPYLNIDAGTFSPYEHGKY